MSDYATKVCLGAQVSARIAGRDATDALAAAIANAEALLGHMLLEDSTDAETGELTPLIVVTDNGPAYKSDAFAPFIAARPALTHVRTRHYAPQTSGVVERLNESLKYEHLYREEISDGQALVEQVVAYRGCSTTSGRTRRWGGRDGPPVPRAGLVHTMAKAASPVGKSRPKIVGQSNHGRITDCRNDHFARTMTTAGN